MLRDLKPWPVVAGLLVDFGGSFVLAIGHAAVRMASHASSGARIADEIPMTPTDFVVITVIGLSLVVAGGYVAGRMAHRRRLAHGVCVGFGVLAVTLIIEQAAPDPSAPLWFNMIAAVGVLPAAITGSYLAPSTTRANRLQPTSGAAPPN